jgi:hypothetical protein
MSRADLSIAAGYVAIAGGAGLLAYFITLRITKWRGIRRSMAASLAAAPAACAIGLLLWNPPVAEVRIDAPADTAVVNGRLLLVEGTVSPPDAMVQILVHPSSEYDDPWWVQPAPVQEDGAWDATIRLGKRKEGGGQYFQIVAVASPRPRLLDLLHYQRLEQGQRLDELPALPRSDIVTVWREQ